MYSLTSDSQRRKGSPTELSTRWKAFKTFEKQYTSVSSLSVVIKQTRVDANFKASRLKLTLRSRAPPNTNRYNIKASTTSTAVSYQSVASDLMFCHADEPSGRWSVDCARQFLARNEGARYSSGKGGLSIVDAAAPRDPFGIKQENTRLKPLNAMIAYCADHIYSIGQATPSDRHHYNLPYPPRPCQVCRSPMLSLC